MRENREANYRFVGSAPVFTHPGTNTLAFARDHLETGEAQTRLKSAPCPASLNSRLGQESAVVAAKLRWLMSPF